MRRSFLKGGLAILFAFLSVCASQGALVTYLNFDESSGDAVDRSGNGRYGILNGGTEACSRTLSMSGFGNALSVDGRNGYLSIPGLDGYYPSYTLVWWMNPSSLSPNRPASWNQLISGIGSGPTFFAHSENNGGWYMGTANTTGRFEASQTAGSLQIGAWSHHAYVYDGPTGTGYYYNNGTLRASGPQGHPVAFTDLWFGQPNVYTIHGQVDDVAFFDRALDAGLIADLADKSATPLTVGGGEPTPTPTPLPIPPGHDRVLLGMHFLDSSMNHTPVTGNPPDVAPIFDDYVQYMPEDLAAMSYADFWRWWYVLERYKGDEKGLADLEALTDACLGRGLKVKIDVAWSTWYTENRDWLADQNMAYGPPDLDDWTHLCDLVGRRFKGRILLWMLQGEANSLQGYWRNAPIGHVHDVYRLGCRAFKRLDPQVLVSISGATPSASREDLDVWYRSCLTACQGFYDDVPMNYFADVQGADPYNGLINYYQAIKTILDELNQSAVEIGSGESSIQWALSSTDIPPGPAPIQLPPNPATAPLSEVKQSWRMNESMGTFFSAGGNKFMWWGTEYAPGAGWPWRWGFRKYQDWWGIWPVSYKIQGTNIVYTNGSVDLRPGWVTRSDPYHPVWEVFKFWSQVAPAGSEAIRVPMTLTSSGPRILRMASYLQTLDQCVVLLQNDDPASASLSIDLSKTGWKEGTQLSIAALNEGIDYATRVHNVNWQNTPVGQVQQATVQISLPSATGFTTLRIQPATPAFDALYQNQFHSAQIEVGQSLSGSLVVKNSGNAAWPTQNVTLALYEEPDRTGFSESKVVTTGLVEPIAPGATAVIPLHLPVTGSTGYVTRYARLHETTAGWFGPVYALSTQVVDFEAPRKLVALRGVGHVRLKWFAPERPDNVESYDLYRAPGFEQPMQLLANVTGTEYIDVPPAQDKAYYYQVLAVRSDSSRSRPSNEDNAKAQSGARYYDAEVVSHSVPERLKPLEQKTVTITVRNTGSRSWNTEQSGLAFFLNNTQLWGSRDEGQLPKFVLQNAGTIAPGGTVTFDVPYSTNQVGKFENHWIFCMDIVGASRVYFGTPLLVETVVENPTSADGIWLK